jgi:hypothetical protein
MGREKDRKLRRRQRRQLKLRKLKARLVEVKSIEERDLLIEKIRRISLDPKLDLRDYA